MKRIATYLGLIAAASLGTWALTGTTHPSNVMNDPPTDSGFAVIQTNARAAKLLFAYKYGSGKSAKYQCLWQEDKMDTLKWKNKEGKDTITIMPHPDPTGHIQQVYSTVVWDAKWILQWYPKTTQP